MIASTVRRSGKNRVFDVAPVSKKERSGASEEEEHERRLVMDGHVLAQYVGVLVVGVDLEVGIGVVLGGF